MTNSLTPLGSNLPASPLPYNPDLGPSGGQEELNPLVRLMSAIRRFYWLIILGAVLGLGGGYLATRFMVPEYVVTGDLILEEREASSFEATSQYVGAQWMELLKLSSTLEPVVLEQNLFIVGPNPTRTTPTREGPTGPDAVLFEDFRAERNFIPGDYEIAFSDDGTRWTLRSISNPGVQFSGMVGDKAGEELRIHWTPRPRQRMHGQKYRFTLLTPGEVVSSIRGALRSEMNPLRGRFVSVRYSATDRERARRTLDAILKRFVTEADAHKKNNLQQRSHILDSQLLRQEELLRQQELALEKFNIATVTSPREDVPVPGGLEMTTNFTYGSYMQQSGVIDSLKRERRALGDLVNRAAGGELAADQLRAIGIVRTSLDLMNVIDLISREEQALGAMIRGEPGENGLAMRGDNAKVASQTQKIRELRANELPRYAQAVINRVDAEIADRERRASNLEQEMQNIPTRTITRQRLERELNLTQQTHAEIQREAQIARFQAASVQPDVRILSIAEPPLRPTKNRSNVIMILGLLGGLGAGIGIAFLLELLDKRFRYAQQITSGLGLTILGAIPEIRRAKGKSATAEEAAQVVEAFRTVRLNLAHVYPDDSPILLTVTSPMPGDGKSLISSNLALSFAEAGYRTLLIDGDTRRGELHRTFGTDRRPGLLDHLAGDQDIDGILRPTQHSRLTLMPAGSRHRNAPELMGSKRMQEMITALKERFNVIIIDSPPLAAGIDPFVLGTVTGNLMMVVRAGSTDRDLAEHKLQIIDRLPIRLVGAVLNDVRSNMSEYKYYSYNYTYGETEEDEQPMLPAPLRTPEP